MIGRGDHGIVHCGPTARINMFKAVTQLFEISSEVLINVRLVVEINDEDFVIRIAGFHQIQRRLIHRLAFVAHRSGVVDQDSQRDRHILLFKSGNLLRLPVFKNLKVVLVETRHRPIMLIDNCSV